MSLPPELRVLCHQLSHTPTAQLPHVTTSLQRLVFQCQGPLSISGDSTSKSDSSETSVLVHKLKTQISTLLHGRTAEGRFTAVVLIKSIIDTGGWEVLRGAESWVRGLLGVLGKKDSIATQRLCILTLTGIYLMTHQYQSLVREITTPTLKSFVSSCLNIVSKSSKLPSDIPSPLTDTVFEAFSRLVPHHPTIFRPFLKDIRAVTRDYLTATSSDGTFVSSSLSQSARRLIVHLHQTAPKNAGGEEWGKAVRDLIRQSHETADVVFRAVIEDWESTTGYFSQQVDVNGDIHGGAKSEDDLPAWNGIDAGIERLTGLLALLEEHFKYQTPTAVTIPLDSLIDLLTRLLSITPPNMSKKGSDNDGMRLHPAIERNEREGLWCGLPNTHIAAMRLYSTLIDRIQTGFTPYSQSCLEQVAWTYPTGKKNASYREFSYRLTSRVLRLSGPSLPKSAVSKLSSLLAGCCREFSQKADAPITQESEGKPGGSTSKKNGVTPNVDSFLKAKSEQPDTSTIGAKSAVQEAAAELLPLFLSHLPQQHLEAHLRIEIERTAILTHEKNTMLASILNPYVGKNGRAFPSILPHATREFSEDPALEAILRPRMPVLLQQSAIEEPLVPDELQVPAQVPAQEQIHIDSPDLTHAEHVPIAPRGNHTSASSQVALGSEVDGGFPVVPHAAAFPSAVSTSGEVAPTASIPAQILEENDDFLAPPVLEAQDTLTTTIMDIDTKEEEDNSSDSASVHLNMELSDSDSDGAL